MNERTKRRSFLKKVNEEFLKKMSDDECTRFTDNIGGFIQVIDYLESNQFKDGAEFIDNAFDWDNSPEEFGYWYDLAKKLEKFRVDYNENVIVSLDIVNKLNQQLKDLAEENQSLKVDLQQANLKLDKYSKPYVSEWQSIWFKMIESRELKSRSIVSLQDGFTWLAGHFYPPVSKTNDEDN